MKKLLAVLLSATMLLFATSCAATQPTASPSASAPEASGEPAEENPYASWPEDTVILNLPVSAGGNVDNYSRIIAEWFEKETGKALVIENLNTGSGSLCYETTRMAPADGYNLMMYNGALFAAYYTGKYDYNPLEVFEPLASTQIMPATALCVPANSPYTSFEDLINAAKEKPDTVTVGVSSGSTADLAMQHVNIAADVQLKIVDAGNDGDRLTALLGGAIEAAMLKSPSAHKYVQTGELRILALTDDGNGVYKDEYPSVCNLGYPEVVYGSTCFIFAPKGIDPKLAERINEVFQGLYTDETAIQKSEELGAPFRVSDLAGAVAECQAVSDTIQSCADAIGLEYKK